MARNSAKNAKTFAPFALFRVPNIIVLENL